MAECITDEMVERGAIGLWQCYKRERTTGRMAPEALKQGRRTTGWDDVAIKSWYRRRARAVLVAALEGET